MDVKKKIENVLKNIPDPELGISLWDLGLIYDIIVKNRKVKIIMTLTTIGCPLFSVMANDIKEKVRKIKGVEDVEIELTFDPQWGPEKMSKEAKETLGF